MAFWGCQVTHDKGAVFVPPPEASKLHISQACLAPGAAPGARATLLLTVGDGEPLAVCTLREGSTEHCGLDLVLDRYTEFTVQGHSGGVHLTGYFMPDYEIGGEDGDEDDEHEALQNGGSFVLGYDEDGRPVLADEYDSEEDSDYESEEDDDDEDTMRIIGPGGNEIFFSDADLGEYEDGSDDDFRSAHEGPMSGRKSSVTIEDITDAEPDDDTDGAPPASAQAALASGSKKAVAFEDDDVEASDEEDAQAEEAARRQEAEAAAAAAAKAAAKALKHNNKDSSEEPAAQGGKKQQKVSKEKSDKQPVGSSQEAAGQKRKAEAEAPAPAQASKADKKAKKEEERKKKKAKKEAASAAKKEQEAPQSGDGEDAAARGIAAGEVPSGKKHVRRFANGFEIEEVSQGRPDGKLAKPGKRVAVRYVGRLKSGAVFDQTSGSKTFTFRLGVGEVIKGWDRGVEGMRVGDKRRVVVPPAMGYGSSKVGNAIPPNSTLVFDIELVDVKG